MSGEELEATVPIEAIIGELVFKPEYSDPEVKVIHNRERTDHSIVSGDSNNGSNEDFAIQARGEKPTQVEITGMVTGDQIRTVDNLVSETVVAVITDRWLGTAVPEDVRTGYDRNYHEEYGMVVEATISLLAVTQGQLPNQESFTRPATGGDF